MFKNSLLISLIVFSTHLNAQGYLKMREKAEKAFNNYEYDHAVTWAQDAILLAEVEVGKNSVEYANCLSELGIYLYYNYRYEEGIQHIEDACIIKKNLLGENDKEYILSYSDLGSLYYMSEYYEKSLHVFEHTAKVQREISGSTSIDLAYELNKIGLAQTSLGMYNEAAKNLKECRYIFEKNKLTGEADYASILNNLANLYHSKGNYLDAEEYYRDASKQFARTEGKESYNYVSSLQNLGNLYAEMGRFEEAESLFNKSLKINEVLFSKNSIEWAQTLNDLAYVAHHMGNYIESEKKYREVLNLKKALSGKETATYEKTLNNLAVLYLDYGNFTEAQKILEPLVARSRLLKEEAPLSFLIYAENLVILYFQIDEMEKAKTLNEEVMLLKQQKIGVNSHEYAISLNNLSEILRRQRKFRDAQMHLDQSLKILEELGHESTMDYYIILYQAGMNYLDMKQYQKAREYLMRAHELSQKQLSWKNSLFNSILINLGDVLNKLNETDMSKEMFVEAMNNYMDIINHNMNFMSTAEKSKYIDQIELHVALFNSFAASHYQTDKDLIEKMYEYNAQLKSIELRSFIRQREDVMASKNSALIEQYKKWSSQKEYLNKLYQLPQSELTQSGINLDSLELASNNLEKSIYQQVQKSPVKNSVEIKDLSKVLAEDEVAIEIIRIPHYGSEKQEFDIDYLAIVVYPEGKSLYEIVLLDNGRKLDNELSDLYYEHLFNKTEDNNSYHLFWKEIADKINAYKKVYLARDGIYNIINVNTLKNIENNEYVLDSWEIHYVASTTDLINYKFKNNTIVKRNSGGIHLFGYPDYYYSVASELSDGTSLDQPFGKGRKINAEFQYISDLPGTKKEVQSINDVLSENNWQTSIYLERDATESKLKSIDNPTVLHIATHGYFEYDIPKNPVASNSLNRLTAISQPLLRSGIMMAGSAYILKLVGDNIPFISNVEDGVLNGIEASNMHLDNTDLVVLSACLTSIGEAKVNDNEGYFGMLSAFLSAGAQSVIASCWSVDDEATKELMISFYSNWQPESTYYDAFRKAQLQTREKFEHPFYWGAFIMVE